MNTSDLCTYQATANAAARRLVVAVMEGDEPTVAAELERNVLEVLGEPDSQDQADRMATQLLELAKVAAGVAGATSDDRAKTVQAIRWGLGMPSSVPRSRGGRRRAAR